RCLSDWSSDVCSSDLLEHVPEPAPLLREAARLAPAVLVEVPLEANRSAARPAKRAEAARIGHVQFLDRAGVRSLFGVAGLSVRRSEERRVGEGCSARR